MFYTLFFLFLGEFFFFGGGGLFKSLQLQLVQSLYHLKFSVNQSMEVNIP